MHHETGSADGNIGAGPFDLPFAQRDRIFLVRHFAPLTAQRQMVEEDHRVVITDGGFEQPLDIIGRAGHDHFDQRQVHKERVDSLAMMRAGANPAAVLGHKDNRQFGLTAKHIAHGRSLVGNLVKGQVQKGAEHQVNDRAQAGCRRANARAGNAQFRNRRIDHPLVTKLRVQTTGAGKDANAHIFANQQHILVATHLLTQRRLNRSNISFTRHSVSPSLYKVTG